MLQKCSDEYRKKAKNLVETRFLSVEDAKGMQWDSVVLVNFFTDSKKVFDSMLGAERSGHRSTIHRMLFNRFYVALTRAENRIIVYESDPSAIIAEKMLTGLVPLTDLSELRTYFKGKMREGDWMKRGDQEFALRNYERAAYYYSRSSRPEARPAEDKAVAYYNASLDKMELEKQIELYLGERDYYAMLGFYERNPKSFCHSFLSALLEDAIDAEDAMKNYFKLPKKLSEGERTMFLHLCLALYNRTIDDDIKRLKRRL